MRLKIPLLLFLTGIPFADVVPASAAWSFRSGETLPGEPTAFDFERHAEVRPREVEPPFSDAVELEFSLRFRQTSRQKLPVIQERAFELRLGLRGLNGGIAVFGLPAH
jgi:hypothetical protein